MPVNRKSIAFLLISLSVVCLFLVFVNSDYLTTSSQGVSIKLTPINASHESQNDAAQISDYDMLDFEGFNNEKGYHKLIVPNYVHLIYLKINKIAFYQAVNIYAIFLNQKPKKIFIHCDECKFEGRYWDEINSIKELKKILVINQVPTKDTIFGVKVGWIQHRADVLRILVLMNYGGIYLDNDCYLVNSFDKYRNFEMVVSWDDDKEGIGNQVFIANRNARFLKAYFDSYRTNYTADQWYYNAGHAPAAMLLKYRYLVHPVKIKLGSHMLIHNLYKTYWKEWRDLDNIHLLMGHRSYLDENSPIKEFDEENIKNYNFTYGEMARSVLDRISKYIPK